MVKISLLIAIVGLAVTIALAQSGTASKSTTAKKAATTAAGNEDCLWAGVLGHQGRDGCNGK